MIMRQYKKAFTLAEVLITLGIIGVVAAMTIPTLMNQTNDKQTVVALKKAYTVLSQAYLLAAQENGTPDNWDLVARDSPVGAKNIMDKLSPYLKIIKNCGDQRGCWAETTTTFLNGSASQNNNDNPAFYKVMLADGISLLAYSYGACTTGGLPTQQICGYAAVDVNGFKKPSKIGADIFGFSLTRGGFVPYGASQGGEYPFEGYCKDISVLYGGIGCTAWVIYNENLDYLKCNDLDWHTKTKCN